MYAVCDHTHWFCFPLFFCLDPAPRSRGLSSQRSKVPDITGRRDERKAEKRLGNGSEAKAERQLGNGVGKRLDDKKRLEKTQRQDRDARRGSQALAEASKHQTEKSKHTRTEEEEKEEKKTTKTAPPTLPPQVSQVPPLFSNFSLSLYMFMASRSRRRSC